MTRETKIGLLVGLAFVIVIGILISDHLSSTNEPMGAPLRAAADNVRSSLGQQGSDDVAPPLRVPTAITPQQQVVTAEELNHRSSPPIHFVDPPANSPQPQSQMQVGQVGNPTDRLRQIARQNGEDLVDPNNPGNVAQPNNQHQQQSSVTNTVARTYQAQRGDSLGAIAVKAYGSGCKANRDAIVAANPALAANRDLIVAGRTYVIPALNGTSSTPAAPTPTREPTNPAETTVTYIVKPQDTLWSIANSQLGSPTAVAAIEELNKEVLNGSDRLRPNMKLKLPARTAVTRNDE